MLRFLSSLTAQSNKARLFSFTSSRVNMNIFIRLVKGPSAGVSKVFLVRAKYRKISKGPGHTLKVTY